MNLPLKFKLFYKGKHVGYEEHLNDLAGNIVIVHWKDENNFPEPVKKNPITLTFDLNSSPENAIAALAYSRKLYNS